MDFNVVIDISSFIWNKSHFETNKFSYHNMINDKLTLLDAIQNANVKGNVIMRNELLKEIWVNFPYNNIPASTGDFEGKILRFLMNTELVNYPANHLSNITSYPNQIKPFFLINLQTEIEYLLTKIHLDNETKHTYFTFNFIWNCNHGLVTKTTNVDKKEYETIIVGNNNQLKNYFSSINLIFKHSNKHSKANHRTKEAWLNTGNKSNFESQLSCYVGDCERPQKLLDLRFDKCYGNDYYYSYDDENTVFVVFKNTEKNIYHAYDVYDIARVPQEVKNHFHIWKY